MFSVFSDKKKVTDAIVHLQNCAGSKYTRILFAGSEDEPLYILKPKAIDLLIWMNTKILFELPKIKTQTNAQWVGVRIRIADNMLLKLVDSGAMTRKLYDKIHYFLCNNVWNEVRLVANDGLPF